MKKLRSFAILSLIIGLLLVMVSIVVPIIKFNDYNAQNSGAGIIDGADMPTMRFLLKSIFDKYLLLPILILGETLVLSGVFCLAFKKTIVNNCEFKTTALSFIISFFGGSGLTCHAIWYSICSFHEMSNHPISYPFSVVGGLASLLAFSISVLFYIKARKINMSIKGIIIDVLTSVAALPFFFSLCMMIYGLLKRFV